MAGIRYNGSYNITPRDNTDIILWLFLSVVLHAILVTLFALSPHPSKKIIYSPVYEVDLVPTPDVAKSEPPAPIQEEVRPVEKPKPEKVVVHKARKSSKAAAMQKTMRKAGKPDDAIIKMREKIAAEEAVDRIRKKMREKEPAASASGSGVKIAQRAPSRVYQYEELDAELKAYFDKISRRIFDAWILPESLSKKGYKAKISIHVLRDGTVESLWIETSGNRYYDDSAIRAINKVTPIPSLPKVWKEEYIDFEFGF